MQIDPAAYRATFFEEVRDHTAVLEGALLRLDAGAIDRAAVDEAFRAAHSVKGGADAVGFPYIAKFTHALESLLDRFRALGQVPQRVLDLLLEGTDALVRLVHAARVEAPAPSDINELLERLASQCATAAEMFAPAPAVAPNAAPGRRTVTVAVTPHTEALRNGLDPLPLLRELAGLGVIGRVDLTGTLPEFDDLDPEQCHLAWNIELETDRPDCDLADIFAFAPDMIQAVIAPVETVPITHQSDAAQSLPLANFRPAGDGPTVRPAPPCPAASAAPLDRTRVGAPKAASHPEVAAPVRRAADKETVRVDKDRLDKLINTIGELVIAQSMAQQEFDELNSGTGRASLALPELAKISRDLQELSLSLRMVPLQGTFQKLTRLVRDLSRKTDKPVELLLHGEETELDKTVVDQLSDPLMHMVRNAIDHGLEPPADRLAAGKSPEGHITLRAYHQGGSVYLELTDDGKGLDRDRILRKAVEKGIVADGVRLTDAEIYALIFEPGFSTAATVTDISGRGVGMDVVRRNVEALQGNILIRTRAGQGTTFTVRLPLTLAIMDGLMVGLDEDVYVIPLLSVIESFRPRRTEVHTVAGCGQVVTVRGEVVPILRLNKLLGRRSRVTDPCHGLVVLVEDQGKKLAVLVDELLGQMQAVVKSLDANYKRIEGLAGATILGDGRVAMILDVHGLAQLHTQFGRGRFVPELASDPSDITLGDGS